MRCHHDQYLSNSLLKDTPINVGCLENWQQNERPAMIWDVIGDIISYFGNNYPFELDRVFFDNCTPQERIFYSAGMIGFLEKIAPVYPEKGKVCI